MSQASPLAQFKSPLHQMTQVTPTCLWNDSAATDELTYSIQHGAAGATCNPVIVLGVLKKDMAVWRPRIQALVEEMPAALALRWLLPLSTIQRTRGADR